MKHEFKILGDIVTTDKEGKDHIVRRDVVSKAYFDIRDIMGTMEIWGNNGKKFKTQCRIFIKDIGEMTVKEKYENVQKLLKDTNGVTKVGGFKRWEKEK